MPPLGEFVGERLLQALEARMKTRVWLADQAKVSPAAITKYTSKGATPNPAVLRKIADSLKFPPSFFFSQPGVDSGSPFLMRSMASATLRARRSAMTKTRWLREIVSYVSPQVRLPGIDVPEVIETDDPCTIHEWDIEDAATSLRRHWGMQDGPISDLTGLLESHGVVASLFDFGTAKLDAFSQWSEDRPIVAVNVGKCTAARGRFDLAHELGHLVMHRRVEPRLANLPEIHSLMEKQAHRFAGAFLFPHAPFSSEVFSVRLGELIDLKSRWGLSAQAMVYRAHDLELIGDQQKTRAWKAMSAAGYRRREPLDDEIPVERPGILASTFRELLRAGVTLAEIRRDLHLPAQDIEQLTGLDRGTLANEEPVEPIPGVVIPFRRA